MDTHLSAWRHLEGVRCEGFTWGGVMRNIRHEVYVKRAQDADAREF